MERDNFMEQIPCPLCGSSKRRVFWSRESYPVVGGRVVPVEKAKDVPWLPLEISLCLDCFHIYQSCPPESDLLESFYAGNYVTSSPSVAYGGTPPKGLSLFFEIIKEVTGTGRGLALEIGAYDGYFLHLLNQDGWDTVGYEPAAIGKIGSDKFGLDIRGEFYEPGKSGAVWDLVVSRYVFEHLEAPRRMLEGIFKETAPGGWLALEVPDLQMRLSEGILGCFAHEHISYFLPATLRNLIEETGFEVKRKLNTAGGLAVFAQKPVSPSSRRSKVSQPIERSWIEELISRFEERRTQRKERFARELSRWSGPDNFMVYGGDSHTTDLLVEGWLPVERVSAIIDDDPLKQGMVAAGFSIPIVSRAHLPEPGQALIVLSAFGHHDRLWDNLADWRSRGGSVLKFYPECQLYE
jgi:SAM-dependent methyltransferase